MNIVWTDFAISNLKNIFDYYTKHASKRVAHKIRRQILESTHQLIHKPETGQIEIILKHLNQNHRYIVVNNYKIIYRIFENSIIINDVFDTRQDPIKMMDKKRLSK